MPIRRRLRYARAEVGPAFGSQCGVASAKPVHERARLDVEADLRR
jgi:hypothetical protein